MKTQQYLDIYAVGGTSFDVRLLADYDSTTPVSTQDGKYLGRTEVGSIDSEGQYEGDDDEIIEHVREQYDIADEIKAGVR